MRVGVISDTHGSLPAAVHDVFAGVDRIIHAGDIGSTAVIAELETIAPVTAVHGNTDFAEIAFTLPGRISVAIGSTRFLVGHVLAELVRSGIPDDVDVIVFGHTHVSLVERRSSVLYVNPGSASRSRGGHGHTVAVVEDAVGGLEARIVGL
ncbi:MAG: metallophosphoesterase family protein [Coriobacteriia bacterium]|nr:metallophosphoesterase family protein [Coriobacteriia bacterium]